MKVAVFGASGRTGREVVAQALVRGNSVVAASRTPNFAPATGLETRVVDVHDRESVSAAVAGCGAVISTLGVGASRGATTTYSAGVSNLLAAMQTQGIMTIAVVSAAPVGPRAAHPWFTRALVMPILDHFFGASYADMARMEALLAGSPSAVAWVALRPPRLLAKPATGHYRAQPDEPLRRGLSITCADLATALLDSLDRQEFHRHAVYVAN
jgi:putative NADH-flavin reductase